MQILGQVLKSKSISGFKINIHKSLGKLFICCSSSVTTSGLSDFLHLHDTDPVPGEISGGLQPAPQGNVVSVTQNLLGGNKGDSSYQMLLERHFKV